MKANRAQICSIFGLSRAQFDLATREEGFPGRKGEGSRGRDWEIDTIAFHKWQVARALEREGSPHSDEHPSDDAGIVIDFDKERARLTKEQADKLARERRQDERELGSVAAMRRLIERLVGGANARLGALPAKLAPVVRPDDPVTARRPLELAVEEVRAELRRLEVDEARDAAA